MWEIFAEKNGKQSAAFQEPPKANFLEENTIQRRPVEGDRPSEEEYAPCSCLHHPRRRRWYCCEMRIGFEEERMNEGKKEKVERAEQQVGGRCAAGHRLFPHRPSAHRLNPTTLAHFYLSFIHYFFMRYSFQ